MGQGRPSAWAVAHMCAHAGSAFEPCGLSLAAQRLGLPLQGRNPLITFAGSPSLGVAGKPSAKPFFFFQ